MKISQKLALGFLAIVSLVAVVGYVCLHQLQKIAEPMEQDIPKAIRAINESSHLDGSAQFIRYYDEVLTQSARNFAFTKDKKWEKRYKNVEPKLGRIIKEAIERGDEKDKDYFSSVDKANLALVEMEYEAIKLTNNGQAEKAVKILEDNEYWNQKKIYEKGLRDYVQRKGAQYSQTLVASTEEVELASNQTRNLIETSTFLVLVFIAIALILSIVTGCFIFYSISNPIAKLKAAIAQIGTGKLDTRAKVKSNDEVGQLAASFNRMAEDLSNTTTSISELNKEITERKQAEEDRKQSELKFRTLYESSSDAVMLLDEKGFFDCNEATVRMFACKDKKEFCSKHPADLFPAAPTL